MDSLSTHCSSESQPWVHTGVIWRGFKMLSLGPCFIPTTLSIFGDRIYMWATFKVPRCFWCVTNSENHWFTDRSVFRTKYAFLSSFKTLNNQWPHSYTAQTHTQRQIQSMMKEIGVVVALMGREGHRWKENGADNILFCFGYTGVFRLWKLIKLPIHDVCTFLHICQIKVETIITNKNSPLSLFSLYLLSFLQIDILKCYFQNAKLVQD